MKLIKHAVKHYYQPTNYSCTQTALAILLSHYNREITPQKLLETLPVYKDESGNEEGSINQEVAVWCIAQGFAVNIYTSDFQIIDLSWANLSKNTLLQRLEQAKPVRDVPALGKKWSTRYVQSYIDFVKAGGNLHIRSCITTILLNELLASGPLLIALAPSVLYNTGRNKSVGLRKNVADDIHGTLGTHSVVLYGVNSQNQYLLSDPYYGDQTVQAEQLICSIQAAQLECDNLIFTIAKNEAA